MPRFAYTAIDARGSEKSGLLDAPDADQAVASLKARGLFPTNVTQGSAARVALPSGAGAPKKSARALRLPFFDPVSPKELSVFTRQLATLLHAGMPLLRGLEVLAKQEKNQAFQEVIAALGENIRSGGTLSEAMARHPEVFDRLFVNMIKAGEAGGVLDVVLERLARFQEKSLQLRGKVKAALVYPLIVMAVAVIILAGLLVFVVPKFKQIFADLLKGAPLPPLTQFVLTVSDAVRNHFLLALGVGAGLWFAFRAFRKSRAGARFLDTLAVRLPPFGDLFLKALIARFSRTLGTLLSSGVPILQALLITRDTSGNARVAEAIDFVHDRVKEGDPVARPLESAQVFPPMVTSMIDVGEHTGQLPEMLTKIADIYDEEVDNAVAGLSSLIEPILIVFLAVVVGTIVIALFLPIIRIVQLMT
ncbi:MAG: type II secretion system F family protein [Opitutae bacterium]|nr:type II secretion system F family protein [Opitutae bacterium]